jgi:hypothetical protein
VSPRIFRAIPRLAPAAIFARAAGLHRGRSGPVAAGSSAAPREAREVHPPRFVAPRVRVTAPPTSPGDAPRDGARVAFCEFVRALLRACAGLSLLIAASCSAGDGSDDAEGSAPAELRSDRVDAWLDVAARAGARPLAEAKTIVIGLRGYELGNGLHDTKAQKSFDDTFVVLRDGKSSLVFAGSTHPFEQRGTSGVPDVNGDGQSDVGMVRPGLYRTTRLSKIIDLAPVFWVKTATGSDKLPAWRDLDHDGVVSDDERARSEQRQNTVDSILFHVGSDAAPKAVGCQVSTRAVLRALADAAPDGFDYVLVDAKTLAAIPELE